MRRAAIVVQCCARRFTVGGGVSAESSRRRPATRLCTVYGITTSHRQPNSQTKDRIRLFRRRATIAPGTVYRFKPRKTQRSKYKDHERKSFFSVGVRGMGSGLCGVAPTATHARGRRQTTVTVHRRYHLSLIHI
eukprot:1781626-Prymnesium_polylepis.2